MKKKGAKKEMFNKKYLNNASRVFVLFGLKIRENMRILFKVKKNTSIKLKYKTLTFYSSEVSV